MAQVQEGLTTMNDIIRGTKEQNLISLTHQQTLMGDELHKSTLALDDVRSALSSRQESCDFQLSELAQKLTDLEQASFKHASALTETLESELARHDRSIQSLEHFLD